MATEPNGRFQKEFQRLTREVVLCLAGIFAVHDVDDDVVWEAARALDQVIERSRSRLHRPNGDRPPTGPGGAFRPHPAMEELLRRVEAAAANTGGDEG